MQEAEVTEKSINEAREHYRPAATRGSILYFVVADLSLINPMYQFSLTYFTKMFSYCIDRAEKADDVPTRLVLLSDGIAEATDMDGKLFGFERVLDLLRTSSSAAEVADAAQSHAAELGDDFTRLADYAMVTRFGFPAYLGGPFALQASRQSLALAS